MTRPQSAGPAAIDQIPELGFYTLAGHAETPRALIDEVRRAEEIGIGAAFISERWNVKEAAVLSGAAGAVSERIAIATAATNHNTRHPVITGSYATTMHRMTGGRFTLGLGRGIKPLFDMLGIPAVTTDQLEDFAGLMRRLWRGETVVGHDGPAGRYDTLRLLDASFDEDIPLGLTAWGPKTCALGGRAFDQIVLHTFFTDETLVRCVQDVRTAAEQAGRDPDSIEIWSVLATITGEPEPEVRLKKVTARLATYLQLPGYGEGVVRANRWDPAVLRRLRDDPVVRSFGGNMIDQVATVEQLEHIATLLPAEWTGAAAYGDPEQCAEAVRRQVELGATGVIMHGATPDELEPVVGAYRKLVGAG
ncbi:TIGR03857 family LLM class F420-dependent oxidoreductase [Pseudonocardia sp. RS11V-5]|uniref:TIGR03857 family LLM class F420-dependent oxidoreductase n=1 Tax=Pseudonocardia terrae TaxID=2905831 RepID=UPI001E39FE4D|nr:TIGR03857 family LLM class F420-dependent oxidoreductase [Pseudonocardia terrae]MCE3552874.1 TIGR03857 family LLM class F420-dependent oxidoreductase [Pseudonocardia terrae]